MILAIDPGTTESAYFVLRPREQFGEFGKVSNDEILKILRGAMYSVLVVEEIQNQGMLIGSTTLQTVVWTGRFQQVAIDHNKRTEFVRRATVKAFWCNSVRAKDANVRQALIDYYGEPGTPKRPGSTHGIFYDMWSALAIAGYWHAKQEGRV